jgi:3-hydroxyisobutyrate dehydrogenase-like beta-hydroxyacid dehydrogenase
MVMDVAFIGLGKMGSGMARNLLRAGHRVTVHNRTRSKADALAADGARAVDSITDAVRDCEVLVTMLADDEAIEQTLFSNGGAASLLKAGAIHIGCSTISTKLARRLAMEHGKRGQSYISAPVFGRPEAAEAKKLLVVTAGPAEILHRSEAVFDAIGRQTFVAGAEPWQANAAKLCGNFMIASMIESFGEAYATLRKANVDPHMFLDVMNALFASPVYANYGRIIADEKFEPAGFALKLGLKDIRLALATAEECQAPMPVAGLIRDHLLSAMALGEAELDWSGLARIAARNAGL